MLIYFPLYFFFLFLWFLLFLTDIYFYFLAIHWFVRLLASFCLLLRLKIFFLETIGSDVL